jgi:hypothetical protein
MYAQIPINAEDVSNREKPINSAPIFAATKSE